MSLSIIICTYDRYDILPVVLASLAKECRNQATPPEILVIDNTASALRQKIDLPQGVRLEVSDRAGLSNARNLGITQTSGDIVAFLDDDAEVCPGYLEALYSGFEETPGALAIGGRTRATFSGEAPEWYSDTLLGYLSCIDWGRKFRSLRKGEFIVGANVAFRREVFDRFGLFDPALGRTGSVSLLSNEESALIEAIGFDSIYYNPKQLVDHHIPKSRLTPTWFRKRVFWQGVSDQVGNMRYLANDNVLREFGEIQANLPPENRGLGFLNRHPKSAKEFKVQLRLIYLLVLLGSDGFPFRAGPEDG